MPRIIAKFASAELAEKAVHSIKDINFLNCMSITSQSFYSGFPCGEPRVDGYAISESEDGFLLRVDTDMAFLPVAIEAIAEEGGVIQ